jgi:hypothetical protein
MYLNIIQNARQIAFVFYFITRTLAPMKKLPHGQPEGPVTVRMSPELQAQLDECAHKTGMKTTDLMRLCMRIGMEHFRRIDYDTAKCIVEAVATQNKSVFTSHRAENLVESPACKPPITAKPAVSTWPRRASAPAPASANTVSLPPQHVVGLNETPQSPPITEERLDGTYPKPKRQRKA